MRGIYVETVLMVQKRFINGSKTCFNTKKLPKYRETLKKNTMVAWSAKFDGPLSSHHKSTEIYICFRIARRIFIFTNFIFITGSGLSYYLCGKRKNENQKTYVSIKTLINDSSSKWLFLSTCFLAGCGYFLSFNIRYLGLKILFERIIFIYDLVNWARFSSNAFCCTLILMPLTINEHFDNLYDILMLMGGPALIFSSLCDVVIFKYIYEHFKCIHKYHYHIVGFIFFLFMIQSIDYALWKIYEFKYANDRKHKDVDCHTLYSFKDMNLLKYLTIFHSIMLYCGLFFNF